MIPARPLDEHGWADKNPLKPGGFVRGTIQERVPGAQPDGDFGMWEPGQARRGVAYTDEEVNPGDVLGYREIVWRVLDTRYVPDAVPGARNACWVSQVEQVQGVAL